MTPDLGELSADHFRPHIGETFAVLLPESPPLEVRLQTVEENPKARMPNAAPESRMPFSLLFTGDPNQSLVTGVLALRHPALGTLPELLINRIMPAGGVLEATAWYQIAFN
jgi:hypothetical protein